MATQYEPSLQNCLRKRDTCHGVVVLGAARHGVVVLGSDWMKRSSETLDITTKLPIPRMASEL